MTADASPGRISIAVVTATHNRRDLLSRLLESLKDQTDQDFTWFVVDDASEDQTTSWVREQVARCAFAVQVVRSETNRGKCASLNVAFAQVDADFYLVVDSDDSLVPSAVADIRAKAGAVADADGVGAIFFAYRDTNGRLLGAPPRGGDVLMTRGEFDQQLGKYDGCVGYFKRVVEKFRYPEFPPETYLGPTVLQMIMAPMYRVLFTDVVVGTAEYQSDGLTASGRRLRLANPMGMMTYTRLRAEQALTPRAALVAAAMYYAYGHIAGRRRTRAATPLRPARGMRAACFAGRLAAVPLATAWKVKYAP